MVRRTFGLAGSILACAWLLAAAPAQDKGGKGDVAKGKAVFEQCAICHNVDSPDQKMGPSLQGLFKKKTLKSGKPVNDANVMAQINNGGNGMPGYADQLSAQEKADLLAYLHTI
jgi:mono/diheme cytochrome c family protein